VGGVNGCGKSTLLKTISAANPGRYRILPGSLLLKKQLGLRPDDYETLQTLDRTHKQIETDRLMRSIISDSINYVEITVIDAHYFHYCKGEMTDVLGEWIRQVDRLFVIETQPEQLLFRIARDNVVRERMTDMFPSGLSSKEKIWMLSDYIQRTRERVKEVADTYQIPWCLIVNNDDCQSESMECFERCERTISL
jgi:adenylate kinase